MVLSIAIHEKVKDDAFALIDQGYIQSTKSIHCPLCGTKYLLLLSQTAFEPGSGIREAVQTSALSYFSAKLCATHNAGHPEDGLIMIRIAPDSWLQQ